MIELDLPFPPSLNKYWRHAKGNTYISEKGRAYRDGVAWLCKSKGLDTLDEPIKVLIWATPPDKRKRDLDNLLKVVLDAMQNGGIYRDDSLIHHLCIGWAHLVKHDPGLKVRIHTVAEL